MHGAAIGIFGCFGFSFFVTQCSICFAAFGFGVCVALLCVIMYLG